MNREILQARINVQTEIVIALLKSQKLLSEAEAIQKVQLEIDERRKLIVDLRKELEATGP
ncbi:MAG: hypothetical protein JWO91_136 [Acidobacteriaceae bacterium]|nr:hypothetical protein [Acidobacteriaceae bacterium]